MLTLRGWLQEGSFALGLSAGFFGFFAHAGFITVLEDEGFFPHHLSGASAGALIAGLWASGLSASTIAEELLRLQRRDFWDPSLGLGLLRGRLFGSRLASLLPVRDFSSCRSKLSVSVYDIFARRTLSLSEGSLAPAIQASCTLPGLFQPLWVNGRPLWDGGIFDRPGLLGLPPHGRVLHHHLASRSPWRSSKSQSMALVKRPGLVTLVIEEIPRVGPFQLEIGRQAFERAKKLTREALDRPIQDNVVRV